MTQEKLNLRALVRVREDFQKLRIQLDNRLGKKADNTTQNIYREIPRVDGILLEKYATLVRGAEKDVKKDLKKHLKNFPIYTEFLKDVHGLGVISASYIISEIDIHEATTVSKIYQYAGLNPSKVLGKKRIKTQNPKTYKPTNGKVVDRGEDYVIVETNTPIRADRLTLGFVAPYNDNLKSQLMGVLADTFIKCKSPYAFDYYYPRKQRYENSTKKVKERKGSKVVEVEWRNATKLHIHMASQRYMIKMFIQDLYNVWRGLEGLEIRPPYAEEYLGKVHSA